MNAQCVVVDANIAFKTLVSSRGDLRTRLDPSSGLKLYSPGFLFVELFKHRERLAVATGLGEDQLLEALHVLVGCLEFVNEANISIGAWVEAYRLCKDVDERDTPYVALTLHLDGRLWTQDEELRKALISRSFNRFYEP